MLFCGYGTIIFLWLLLLTKTKHQEISNNNYDVKAPIVSSRNYSMFNEEYVKTPTETIFLRNFLLAKERQSHDLTVIMKQSRAYLMGF